MTVSHVSRTSLFVVALSLTGCQGPPDVPEAAPPGERVVGSCCGPSYSGLVEPLETRNLVSGITDFGVALFHESAKTEANFAFSPYGLVDALGMVYAGTLGETEQAMAEVLPVLRSRAGRGRFHEVLAALSMTLDARYAPRNTSPMSRLIRTNALWVRQDAALLDGGQSSVYLDTVSALHGQHVYMEDFRKNPLATRARVNTWLQETVSGALQDVLPRDGLSAEERLLLVSTLALHAGWRTRFQERDTAEGLFQTREEGPVPVAMMHTRGLFPLLAGEGYDAVALPYRDDTLRMVIIAPHAGRFDEVTSRLSRAFLDEVRAGLKDAFVALALPRFEVRQGPPLAPALSSLGLGGLFDQTADLRGMGLSGGLWLSHAYQQAPVVVMERGTGRVDTLMWLPPSAEPSTPLTVDRPFVFLIEHVPSGTPLFLGRYVQP
ncbi:serpin family protein [Corallococcus sp. ZKHCc1 1396]|uniref:Serpin family protein n=1 Tax=Corallococcus soli TaxID=2710757 RepID=A0ABR9PW74_9BACT|nr:serpin family protein [Corallococcus soli]MBE4752178.1 serpin family protein [Corallococcus soli]